MLLRNVVKLDKWNCFVLPLVSSELLSILRNLLPIFEEKLADSSAGKWLVYRSKNL